MTATLRIQLWPVQRQRSTARDRENSGCMAYVSLLGRCQGAGQDGQDQDLDHVSKVITPLGSDCGVASTAGRLTR